MASLELRIKALEAPSLNSVPLFIQGLEGETREQAAARYEKETGINPDEYTGGIVLFILFD